MKSESAAAKAVEKTLRGKVQKQTFPPRLEIPQKKRGIPTFHTASTAAGFSLLCGLTGSDQNRQKWIPLSPALTDAKDQSGTRLRATLKGFNETPAVSTPATGTLRAIISEDQSSITFELSYSGLVADSLFAHIHLGQKNVAGGVMIFFCDNSNPPNSPRSCPARGGTVSGTVTAADVIGPAGQGIASGEFSKVIKAIRSGVTYANVHSVQFPPGEIRGQVCVLNRKDDKSD